MKNKNHTSLFQREQVMESLKQSFVKLNPRIMVNLKSATPFPKCYLHKEKWTFDS